MWKKRVHKSWDLLPGVRVRVMSRWSNGRHLDLPNLFDKILRLLWVHCKKLYVSVGFKLCMQMTLFLLRLFKRVWQEGFLFAQSLVSVFYPCLSLNLERFEACGAPCAKSQTRTSWSWSHLFDGWDPGILKKYQSHAASCDILLVHICQCASWMKFEGYCQNFEAFVVPDYDTVVECLHCKEDGCLGCKCIFVWCMEPAAAATAMFRSSYIRYFLGLRFFLKNPRSAPLYEKTWVGEMMNWGSKLPIYNQTKLGLKCHRSVACKLLAF